MSDYIESNVADKESLQKFQQLLNKEIAKGKSKKEADFRQAYPVIEQHLANKVPQRVVIEKFNEAYGYTLHPPAFRKLLIDERNRRSITGDVLTCTTCGQQLISGEKMIDDLNDMEGVNHV